MSGRDWRPVAGERTARSSPVWFQLVDDFTGRAPTGLLDVRLERRDGADWRATGVPPVVTGAGAVAFPGLERRRPVAGIEPRRYRITVAGERYRPLYRSQDGGIEFRTTPRDEDGAPPAVPPPAVPDRVDVVLLPSVVYPYATHVRLLRGEVHDAAGPVEDVLVSCETLLGTRTRVERTLTDARGAFALALRWTAAGAAAAVTATDKRTARTGTVVVAVPAGLGRSRLITIA